MDPNTALERLRHLASITRDPEMGSPDSVKLRWASEMAELFEALDGWLVRGGFPPNAWVRK